jgi:hypothetical protein
MQHPKTPQYPNNLSPRASCLTKVVCLALLDYYVCMMQGSEQEVAKVTHPLTVQRNNLTVRTLEEVCKQFDRKTICAAVKADAYPVLLVFVLDHHHG